MNEKLKPPLIKRLLKMEIAPWEVTNEPEVLRRLQEKYPDLWGDSTAIGPGDDGNCQSWRGDKDWWKKIRL